MSDDESVVEGQIGLVLSSLAQSCQAHLLSQLHDARIQNQDIKTQNSPSKISTKWEALITKFEKEHEMQPAIKNAEVAEDDEFSAMEDDEDYPDSDGEQEQQRTSPKRNRNVAKSSSLGIHDDDWKTGRTKAKKKRKIIKREEESLSIKPRNSSHKLSFREAAIQVLVEQRNLGIQALSTPRIWELITKMDLIDVKGRTPISSLSAMITRNINKCSNKSTFVRVGDGLYALRDGLKKDVLEEFLNKRYRNHNLPLSYKSDAKCQEDGSFEVEALESDGLQESDGINSNSDDLDNVSGSHESGQDEDEEEEEEDQSSNSDTASPVQAMLALEIAPTWVGLPLKTKRNGDILYIAVKIQNTVYRIGDCALFDQGAMGSPYIGRITKLWQSSSKDKMSVKCIRYYPPEETHVGRIEDHHHDQEVFFSDLSDVNNVQSLLAPVEVLTQTDFNLQNRSNCNKKVFFCRSMYSHSTQSFQSL